MAHGANGYLSFPPAPNIFNGYTRRQMWEDIMLTNTGPGTAVGASELIMSRGFLLLEQVSRNMAAVHATFSPLTVPENGAGAILSELA